MSVRAPLLGPRVAERRSCGKPEGGPDPLLVRAYGDVPVKAWSPPTDAELAEVTGAILACRAALAKCAPPPGRRPEPAPPRPEHEAAIGYLRRAIELVDHGKPEAAIERMREAVRALRPEAPTSGKRAG